MNEYGVDPREVRLRLDIESACDQLGLDKYTELLDLIYGELGVRHIEHEEERIFQMIMKFREYERILKGIEQSKYKNDATDN